MLNIIERLLNQCDDRQLRLVYQFILHLLE